MLSVPTTGVEPESQWDLPPGEGLASLWPSRGAGPLCPSLHVHSVLLSLHVPSLVSSSLWYVRGYHGLSRPSGASWPFSVHFPASLGYFPIILTLIPDVGPAPLLVPWHITILYSPDGPNSWSDGGASGVLRCGVWQGLWPSALLGRGWSRGKLGVNIFPVSSIPVQQLDLVCNWGFSFIVHKIYQIQLLIKQPHIKKRRCW